MTDQPKWTPGPWAVEGFYAADDTWHIHGPKGRWLASVNYDGDLIAGADAHLIAAAPDLYAALEDLLAAYSEPDQQICCSGHECGCRGASVRDLAEHHARAAIAKARGQA